MADDEKSDRALTTEEWRRANFMEAIKRLPAPVPMYDNAVVCPWCGAPHDHVLIEKMNSCEECKRPFVFGYPPWEESTSRPLSWVSFPHEAFEALGSKASLLENWAPNERLREIYKYWADFIRDKDMDSRATHHHPIIN